ncbi:unnamed protein product, partial [Prorocentrum cordatum]
VTSPEAPAVFNGLRDRVARWVQKSNKALSDQSLPIKVAAYRNTWCILYEQPSPYHFLFQYYLRDAGVQMAWVGTGKMLLNLEYSEEDDLERLTSLILKAAKAFQADGWWYQGTMPGIGYLANLIVGPSLRFHFGSLLMLLGAENEYAAFHCQVILAKDPTTRMEKQEQFVNKAKKALTAAKGAQFAAELAAEAYRAETAKALKEYQHAQEFMAQMDTRDGEAKHIDRIAEDICEAAWSNTVDRRAGMINWIWELRRRLRRLRLRRDPSKGPRAPGAASFYSVELGFDSSAEFTRHILFLDGISGARGQSFIRGGSDFIADTWSFEAFGHPGPAGPYPEADGYGEEFEAAGDELEAAEEAEAAQEEAEEPQEAAGAEEGQGAAAAEEAAGLEEAPQEEFAEEPVEASAEERRRAARGGRRHRGALAGSRRSRGGRGGRGGGAPGGPRGRAGGPEALAAERSAREAETETLLLRVAALEAHVSRRREEEAGVGAEELREAERRLQRRVAVGALAEAERREDEVALRDAVGAAEAAGVEPDRIQALRGAPPALRAAAEPRAEGPAAGAGGFAAAACSLVAAGAVGAAANRRRASAKVWT